MRKTMLAWSACAAVLLPALGAGTAVAADPPASQEVGQLNGTSQSASSQATSTQNHPSNQAISVAILSPGASSGPVSQTNSSTADSAAGNTNGTTQTATQNGGGSGGTQGIGQANHTGQSAESQATSTQDHPSNQAISVAILSPGASSGPVSQTNSSTADSAAGNTNGTTQTATQNGGGGGTGVQAIGQANATTQSAESQATSTQQRPSNVAVGLAILSPHATSGPVSQTNSSTATSAAGNTNGTTQTATQNGGGNGGMLKTADGCESGCHGHPATTVQGIGQANHTGQSAESQATSTQDHPSNQAISVAILSPGASSGPVSQTNSSTADSAAGNTNGTTQTATQNGGGGGGTGVQAIGQANATTQSAESQATSTQQRPSNVAVGLAILSPHATSGPVSQTNSSTATSAAGNTNGTTQTATQNGGGNGGMLKTADGCESGCHGHPATTVQGIGQLNDTCQDAASEATSRQAGAANTAGSIDVLGKLVPKMAKDEHQRTTPHPSGATTQENRSAADSKAGNVNGTTQAATQSAGRWGVAVQAIGQANATVQRAASRATSEQVCPLNVALGGGATRQDNASGADSQAGSTNGTTQGARQALGALPAPAPHA